jgi:MFS superfamily sulfate permease-like transporter
VAAVALPVGIAYADLAGVPAVIGMYAAIFPLVRLCAVRLVAAADGRAGCGHLHDDGRCRRAAGGGRPDRYLALVIVMTLIVGLVYLGMGMLRLGFIANFCRCRSWSASLNGVALIIIVGQLGKLIGVSVGPATSSPSSWRP